MSQTRIDVTALGSYRNETPYPFCPGCGHGPILDTLNRAFGRLSLDPDRIVLVSDIGCSGLSDQYFDTNAFHGLHGRSITYATGIKLARPDFEVIVLIGDGGTGIGAAHLVHAARRNIGITVLVFNNLNFGMTGGQHSVTTPPGARTSTTPEGALERPFDLCATVAVNGAAYAYRGSSFDKDLDERVAEAIATPGFALLDVWELCTAYFVPRNRTNRKSLLATMEELGLQSGLIHREERAEYAARYREFAMRHAGEATLAPRPLEARFRSPLRRTFRLVAAGSAGAKVRSAARLVGEAAVLSGLQATQRDDYPITVQTGHSLSELVLSPEPIGFTGLERPDALVLLSQDGLAKSGRFLAAMGEEDRVFALPEFANVETRASVRILDPATAPIRIGPTRRALWALARMLRETAIVPLEALEEAARRGRYADENLETIAAARGPSPAGAEG